MFDLNAETKDVRSKLDSLRKAIEGGLEQSPALSARNHQSQYYQGILAYLSEYLAGILDQLNAFEKVQPFSWTMLIPLRINIISRSILKEDFISKRDL